MRSFLIGSIFFIGCSSQLLAFRSCGSATCPLNTFHHLQGGWFNLMLTHEYINQDQIYTGSAKSFVGAIPGHHDEVQTLNERNDLTLQAGLMDNVSLSMDIPFVHREHSHIGHEDSLSTWEQWNFSGIGDLRISAEYAFMVPSDEFSPFLAAVVVIKLPTGLTGLKNAAGEEAEVTLQPGTGSTDGIVALNYRQSVASVPTLSGSYGGLPLLVGASFQFNGKGTYDYRFGNTLLAHLGTAYQFETRGNFLFQINARFQEYSDVGHTDEPRENTGGTWIYASPGLNIQLSDALTATGYVQFPLYQNVHGIQQTAKYNLSFSLSYSLDLRGAE